MKSIEQLQRELELVRNRKTQLWRAFSTHATDHDEWKEARALELDLERLLAETRNEPYAVPFGFPVQWNTGAPLPRLFRNDLDAFLTFLVRQPDDPYSAIVSGAKAPPEDPMAETMALVEFVYCRDTRLGSPHEDVLHGHYLHGRGQDAYTAQMVKNSPWIAELKSINSVHERFDSSTWDALNHYVFWFHDSTFECIAESYKVEVHEMSMHNLALEVLRRMKY